MHDGTECSKPRFRDINLAEVYRIVWIGDTVILVLSNKGESRKTKVTLSGRVTEWMMEEKDQEESEASNSLSRKSRLYRDIHSMSWF